MTNFTDIRDFLRAHCARYPELALQDVFKALYQSAFGCEHLIADPSAAADYIRAEAARSGDRISELVELLGGDYCRVHLGILQDGLNAETFARLFALSARHEECGREKLEAMLTALQTMADAGELPFSAQETAEAVETWRRDGFPPLHHSEVFRQNYAPAYRVLRRDFARALPLFARIDRLTAERSRVLVAIEGGSAPDLIMEGPERLVANWGAKGVMAPLNDLWTDDAKKDIYESVNSACHNDKGDYYEYPLCMTAHCMAVNMTKVKEVGADKYLDTDKHTWSTDGFLKTVDALYNGGYENVAAIYCSGQGGDQGTRAIINNMYGGTFTDAAHTKYTADSAENIKAIQALYDAKGVNFDASINGGEEITLFRNGTLQMAFCWNIAQQLNSDNNDAGLTNSGDEIFPMAFPTESGDPKLCGGIWGFGIFDNGDEAKIEAAKTFIDFIAADPDQVGASVLASTYFPVRESVGDIYAGNDIMSEYTKFMGFLGDYYQITPGWATARTEWWNMLQRVGTGEDVTTAVKTFCDNANAAAAAEA